MFDPWHSHLKGTLVSDIWMTCYIANLGFIIPRSTALLLKSC